MPGRNSVRKQATTAVENGAGALKITQTPRLAPKTMATALIFVPIHRLGVARLGFEPPVSARIRILPMKYRTPNCLNRCARPAVGVWGTDPRPRSRSVDREGDG